ncbi:hypothetical protein R1sor_018970 [Riccia sorocarpa]|uniref:CCHC-type domain-containing protein n=1 Tax=Riccia sorocarpa TaxID=122646 RepID=A0ABD3IB99_9MARC
MDTVSQKKPEVPKRLILCVCAVRILGSLVPSRGWTRIWEGYEDGMGKTLARGPALSLQKPSRHDTAFGALAKHNTSAPDPKAPKAHLNVDIAKQSLGMLSKVGIILFTTEEVPSRDLVVDWIHNEIVTKRQLQVTAIRELARKHFLVLMTTEAHSDELLSSPPQRMFGKAVMFSKWSPNYDYREAAKPAEQVWVELQFVDPLLIAQEEIMLKALGQPLYHTVVNDKHLRYAHIRAYVLMQDLQDLPQTINMETPWGDQTIQEVKYTFLPDTCYKCRQRGHQAAQCLNQQRPPRPQSSNEPTPKQPNTGLGEVTAAAPAQTTTRKVDTPAQAGKNNMTGKRKEKGQNSEELHERSKPRQPLEEAEILSRQATQPIEDLTQTLTQPGETQQDSHELTMTQLLRRQQWDLNHTGPTSPEISANHPAS